MSGVLKRFRFFHSIFTKSQKNVSDKTFTPYHKHGLYFDAEASEMVENRLESSKFENSRAETRHGKFLNLPVYML